MPIYEFYCEACHQTFEKRLSYQHDLPQRLTCPNGHRDIHRVYHCPAILFKGRGFYSTDHRKSNPSARKASNSKTA